MFYLNTIKQLLLFIEQLDQLEVCLPFSRLLTWIPILAVLKNLRWNSSKTSLYSHGSAEDLADSFKVRLIEVLLSVRINVSSLALFVEMYLFQRTIAMIDDFTVKVFWQVLTCHFLFMFGQNQMQTWICRIT